MNFITNKILRGAGAGFLFVVILVVSGCAPSIRYTRDGAQVVTEDGSYTESSSVAIRADTVSVDQLLRVISSYIGTPYKYGGVDRRGLDCSGFVRCVFIDALQVQLPHSSSKMSKLGKKISLRHIGEGDLVFFWGGRRRIDHVGIYTGQGQFAHSSTSRGVIYSDLSEPYYRRHFSQVRRIFE